MVDERYVNREGRKRRELRMKEETKKVIDEKKMQKEKLGKEERRCEGILEGKEEPLSKPKYTEEGPAER